MIVRKVAVGPDYKSAMHYVVGQEVFGGCKIVNILYNADELRMDIWVQRGNEIYLWKSFNHTTPISIEYNINF
jgi:hypothetical protein